MPKTKNWFGGGGLEVIAIYRRRIGVGVTCLTTFMWLRFSVPSSRDPGESLVYLDYSDAVDDEGEGGDVAGLLNRVRYWQTPRG